MSALPPTEDLGDLDGEKIELANLSLAGTVAAGRVYEEGEKVLLVVEGEIGNVITVKRDDAGRLVRVHKLKVTTGAPPLDHLADEASRFLQAVEDERENRQALPFDEEGDEPPDGLSHPEA